MTSKTSFSVTGSINKALEKCCVRYNSGEAVWDAGRILEKYRQNLLAIASGSVSILIVVCKDRACFRVVFLPVYNFI